MSARRLAAVGGILLATACAVSPDDTDTEASAEEALTVIPASYPASKLAFVRQLRINRPEVAVRRPSLFTVPVFELEGTVGDEIEVRVTAKVAGENPALVVLGPPDPTALAACARWSAPSQPSCMRTVASPVLASNDDADATTKNPKLRVKLTSPRLRVGVVGASLFDLVVDSVASGIDPGACRRSATSSSAGDEGSVTRVRLTRECKDYASRDCSPWRELARLDGRHAVDVGTPAGSTTRRMNLVDDGGYYTWIKCTYHDCSTRVSEPCLARTPCTVSREGDVTCDAWHEASVTLNRRTALDADTCNELERPVRFSGVLGERCLSLSSGLERTRTPTGGWVESQTVIVTSW